MYSQYKCGGLLIILVFQPMVHGVQTMDKLGITIRHNWYRSNVNPPAADMLSMSWYKPAAVEAQWWANKCNRSDPANFEDRVYGNCTNNILIAPGKMDWSNVVKSWGSGYKNFTYGMHNNAALVKSYVKMIWAPFSEIGCGSQKCSDSNGSFHIYICNYCPGTIIQENFNTPYKNGIWCSACTGSCKMMNGLCSPK